MRKFSLYFAGSVCGILGICFNQKANQSLLSKIPEALECLKQRGPDYQDFVTEGQVTLAHTRLSIIDTSSAANQPMRDPQGRYTIIFNGEIYNYRELQKELEKEGVSFHSSSDTEVLLWSYIKYGSQCLQKLNGFFAFAIYDKEKNEVFVARDRMGIKPLLYCESSEYFAFASQLQPLTRLGIQGELDSESIAMYLRLSYIPAPYSIFSNIKKLLPGHFAVWNKDGVRIEKYYSIEIAEQQISYPEACERFEKLLDDSVSKRLVSDVPLGTFLSGGLDSSVISSLAGRHSKDLPMFSIGFPDQAFFDETRYAAMMAKKIGGQHHIFNITAKTLSDHLDEILHSYDEPFADSSSVPVNILSKLTRQHVKVALSGDGADELLAGYNKHRALFRARKWSLPNAMVKSAGPLLAQFSGSRNNPVANKLRQLNKYSKGLILNYADRYWEWACFSEKDEVDELLHPVLRTNLVDSRKQQYLEHINGNFNTVLKADMQLVLPNDMLKKVDLMSMNRSLEVRVPFLDHRLVEFAFSLPSEYKITESVRKKLLRDTFAKQLPPELMNRPKKGFEVPLASWLQNELRPHLQKYLNEETIKRQGIFNPDKIRQLQVQLGNPNKGNSPYLLWALLVFQVWISDYVD